jgi:hypothetical protein
LIASGTDSVSIADRYNDIGLGEVRSGSTNDAYDHH